MKMTWMQKKTWKRVFGWLMTMVLLFGTIPVNAAEPDTDPYVSEGEEPETDEQEGEGSLSNNSIGDYTERDDYLEGLDDVIEEVEQMGEPDKASGEYTIIYELENGVSLSENAQETIDALGNERICISENVVKQTFVRDSDDVIAPIVYHKFAYMTEDPNAWKLTYTESYTYEESGGEIAIGYRSVTKYFASTTKVKELQNYAVGGNIRLYPNWVTGVYSISWNSASFNPENAENTETDRNPNLDLVSYKTGDILILKPVTAQVRGYEFTGYAYSCGDNDALAEKDGENWKIDTKEIDGDITIRACWTGKAMVSVTEFGSISYTYGIGVEEQQKIFNESAVIEVTSEKELSEEEKAAILERARSGAVWFIADRYVTKTQDGTETTERIDNPDAVVSENTTVADLRNNAVWTEVELDSKELDAGDYYVVLAFDESRIVSENALIGAGTVCRGEASIAKKRLELRLYDITGTSDHISIPFEEPTEGLDEFGKIRKIPQTFMPSELLSAKVFDADTGEFYADLEEFSVMSENSRMHVYLWGESCPLSTTPQADPGTRYSISLNAIRDDQVKMVDLQGNVLNNSNYTADKSSNKVDISTYVKEDLQLKDAYYSDEFYFPTDEFINTATEKDFTEAFINVYMGEKLIQDYQNMCIALVPASYAATAEERSKEFERIFAEDLSVSEQLKAIAAKNPEDLYANKKIYVAVSHNSLGTSSAGQNDYYLQIRKQPVIFTNAEEIKGLKGKGIIREYGGVNRYGGYDGRVNIGIIDKDGRPILKESGMVKEVEDYSASYSWAGNDYRAENLQSVSGWLNGTYRSYMSIKLGKYGESGQVPYNYGNKQIELSFSYLKDRGLFTNFTPYWDQKYSVYHIADSRNVSFSDFEGNKLRDDPILVEVTQDKDGKNILSFEVASFKGFDGTDKSTKDVKWYCMDANGKMTSIPDNAAEPLAKEGTTDVFTGARFTLDTASYGDAIKLCTKTDTVNEGEFWIKPINPVFYTGVKMVGRQEKLKMGSALYNCSVDIRVMSGTGEQAKELVWNTDYTMTYTNNTNAGTAQVKVTGKGTYKGKKATATFAILPAKFDNAAFVTEKKKTIEFTGKSIDSSMTGTSYFKVYLSYDGKTQVSKTEYTPKVVEYKIADDGTILSKDPLEEYNKYDKNIRYFDVYAVASKDGNFLKGDTCGEDLKVGENLYEHMDRVDVIGTRRGGVKLSYYGLRTAIDYNSKATLKNFADLSKKTVYVKYNKTAGAEKIYLTDKRLEVNLYRVLEDGTREFVCSGADYDKVKLPGSGDYVLRIGPKYYDDNGNTIQGGTLYSVGVYSALEVKLKMRGLKLSSTVVKVAKESKSLTINPDGTVLKLDINPNRKAYFDDKKVLLCYSGIENGSYTVGEGDEELEFYDGSTVKTTIPLMKDGKQLTLADVCVDGEYKINLAEFTDSFGNSLNTVGTGAIVFVSSGGKFYGSYSSSYTIKAAKK